MHKIVGTFHLRLIFLHLHQPTRITAVVGRYRSIPKDITNQTKVSTEKNSKHQWRQKNISVKIAIHYDPKTWSGQCLKQSTTSSLTAQLAGYRYQTTQMFCDLLHRFTSYTEQMAICFLSLVISCSICVISGWGWSWDYSGIRGIRGIMVWVSQRSTWTAIGTPYPSIMLQVLFLNKNIR